MTTVFDPSAVHRLEADTESEPFVRALVGTYQRMLSPRIERVVEAVLSSDTDEALDAALSLQVSSVMTGTVELAEIATFVVDDLRIHDLPAARSRALLLPAAAMRARAALDLYVGGTQPEDQPEDQHSTGLQGSTDSIR